MAEKEFIIFWERLANSGVIKGCMANTPEEAVDKCGFSPKFVKHTVVEGKVLVEIGEAN